MADKEGWLFKKKRTAKNKSVAWTKRWFVLRGTQLTYFKSQDEYFTKSKSERSARLNAAATEAANLENGDTASANSTKSAPNKRHLDIQGANVRSAADKTGKKFAFHITHFVWGTLTLAALDDTSRAAWIEVLERASKAGHLTYNGALETLKLTNDASPEDINSAYTTLVEKHRPENGGDGKSFKFYTNAYNFASQHVKRESLSSLATTTVTITKESQSNGGLGLRVRMRPGGGIEVTQVLNEALKSQVETGDVIMGVNGDIVDTVLSFTEFYELVKKLPEGEASSWEFTRPETPPAVVEETVATVDVDIESQKMENEFNDQAANDAERLAGSDIEGWSKTENDPPACSSIAGCMSFSFFAGGKEQKPN